MKKRIKPNHLMAQVLSCVFALLGFSGCSSEEKDMLLMYGPAPDNYRTIVTGKVVDSENKETGLSDIRILARPNPTDYNYADTLYTNEKGEFTYSTRRNFESGIRLIYEDPANGTFKKDSIPVKETQWNGEYFEADVLIEMERKAAEEEKEEA